VNTRRYIYYPIVLSIVLALGMLLGAHMRSPMSVVGADGDEAASARKVTDILNYVSEEYVDSIDVAGLTDEAIVAMLSQLDPHSAFIPAKDLQAMNEPLEGNFEGIGVEFNIISDTIVVVSAIAGGPSEKLGVMSGDRITAIDGKNVAGIGFKSEDVVKNLRGQKGTVVKVKVVRRGQRKPLEFEIVRDRIPLYSIDAAYMMDAGVGYVKVSRFASTTSEEFLKSLTDLKGKGMRSLILDLRGNPGGYLSAAIDMCDELLPKGELIVYTEGRSRPKEVNYATARGMIEKMPVAVLIDEGSASASEIVAGAVQDNDRGQVIGRRSFGKGLVQEQVQLPDGSALRLTIARYYTPSGRCIQKPYDNTTDYGYDLMDRYEHGELYSADSIRIADTTRYYTKAGKLVRGGGGIVPDLFIPLDTTDLTELYTRLLNSGLLRDMALDLAQRDRSRMMQMGDGNRFNADYQIDASTWGLIRQRANEKKISGTEADWSRIRGVVGQYLKAMMARTVWNGNGYYPVMNADDPAVRKAVEVLSGPQAKR
jgi:carboxyl-terminal processing protease